MARGAVKMQEHTNKNMTAAKLRDGTTIISVYAEPENAEAFAGILASLTLILERGEGPTLITGDFNAKHEIWGSSDTDGRGQALLELVVMSGALIANGPEDPPTFTSSNGVGWTDLTISKGGGEVEHFAILEEEETLSDHNYVEILYSVGEATERNARRGETRYRARNGEWGEFRRILREELEVLALYLRTPEETNRTAERFQEACTKACRGGLQKFTNCTKVGGANKEWWTESLEVMRQDVSRTRRRLQREEQGEERERWKERYRIKRGEFKKAMEEARIDSFRRAVTEAGGPDADPWGFAHKLLRGGRHGNKPRTVMGTVRKTNGQWTIDEGDTVQEMMHKYFPNEAQPYGWGGRRRRRDNGNRRGGYHDRRGQTGGKEF